MQRHASGNLGMSGRIGSQPAATQASNERACCRLHSTRFWPWVGDVMRQSGVRDSGISRAGSLHLQMRSFDSPDFVQVMGRSNFCSMFRPTSRMADSAFLPAASFDSAMRRAFSVSPIC